MRHCVFLPVLLALVLSLSKEENDTINTTTPTTTAIDTTGSSSDTSTTPNSRAITESAGSSSYTSPIPTSTTTTDTTDENSNTYPTPDSRINSDETGSTSEIDSSTTLAATINTTGSTPETYSNPSSPTNTDETGSTPDIDSSTTLAATINTTGENDTINTTTPTTTAINTTGSTSETDSSTTLTTTIDTTRDFCSPNPCGTNLATCVSLNSNYTCLCQYGFYYSDKDCHRGKIFPGVITLQETYGESVLNVNSTQYEELLEHIKEFFQQAFRYLTGFAQTVIVEIQVPPATRANEGTNVTVINLFTQNSNATNQTVDSAINSAIGNTSFVHQYTATTYCSVYNCDAKTTVCEENEFPQCICQSNFSKTEWDTLSCSDCSKNCSETDNMYCAREDGVPTCKCMADFEWKAEKCVPCQVGYSGDECKNNTTLILIIVGTVLGAIILCLAIAVTVVSIRAKHKQDPEKKKLLQSGYSNPNTFDDRQPTMFPRVRTTSGHANPGYQPNNPYETRDFDDLYEASRESEGFRMNKRN